MKDMGISYTRVIAMVFILIDHIVLTINIPFKSYIIQITNTGVLIFLFISGFLYGRKEINNFSDWFIKRAKKIILPLYVFIIFLAIFKIIFEGNINIIEYLKYLINMQGILGVTHGGVHLWFLTVLMICYLITPLLEIIKRKNKELKLSRTIIIIYIYIIVQIFCAYFVNINFALGHHLSTYLIYLLTYIIGYYYSYYIKNKEVNSKKIIFFTLILIISMGIRVISNKLIDGTILYNRIIAMYTNIIFAIWTFVFIKKYYTVINNQFLKKVVNKLNCLSFEIYIVHPLAIELFMNFTTNNIINICFTLITIYIIALLFNKILCCINNMFFIFISKNQKQY
ncbi:MAG: acyltransferase [Bacilli bacterium]|nr:acyltransferase [Bacilli bacterium]